MGGYNSLTSRCISGGRYCSFPELGVEAQLLSTCTAHAAYMDSIGTRGTRVSIFSKPPISHSCFLGVKEGAGTSSEPPDSVPSWL